MSRPLVSNIVSSFADKAFTSVAFLAATLITVRLLPRSDYGVIGVVAGYGALIQIVNIALENAILREHRAYEADPEHFLLNYLFFNVLKAGFIFVLGAVSAALLAYLYANPGFLWAVSSLTILLIGDVVVSPLVLHASARYRQRVVTLVSAARHSLNLLLLLGLFRWPSLAYLAVKDGVVMMATVTLWAFAARVYLGLDFSRVSLRRDFDPRFICETLTRYSLWVHFMAVCSGFIYRADALILSFFAPLSVVGNYSIALSSANVANIAPSILGYHNSVAISYSNDPQEAFRLTDRFLRLSLYIGAATLLGFVILGREYLRLITGEAEVFDIYSYMICIVIGLIIVKTFASPLVAYVNVKGDVRRLFLSVLLPSLSFAAIVYSLAAGLFGVTGVAVSNVVIAVFWLVLLQIHMRRYGYQRPVLSGFSEDWQWVRSAFSVDSSRERAARKRGSD